MYYNSVLYQFNNIYITNNLITNWYCNKIAMNPVLYCYLVIKIYLLSKKAIVWSKMYEFCLFYDTTVWILLWFYCVFTGLLRSICYTQKNVFLEQKPHKHCDFLLYCYLVIKIYLLSKKAIVWSKMYEFCLCLSKNLTNTVIFCYIPIFLFYTLLLLNLPFWSKHLIDFVAIFYKNNPHPSIFVIA